ncbi:MAG: metal-dependent transcriptional regulator, partial [Solirubrobacterales bacterium]
MAAEEQRAHAGHGDSQPGTGDGPESGTGVDRRGGRPVGHDAGASTTEALEDYAKAILALEQRSDEPVGTSALAERLGLTPGSVTAMLKRMEELGLVDYEPYRGARLTDGGRRLALEVVRHHRLLESYLAEALDVPWDDVHAEAEVLEHYISEGLEE